MINDFAWEVSNGWFDSDELKPEQDTDVLIYWHEHVACAIGTWDGENWLVVNGDNIYFPDADPKYWKVIDMPFIGTSGYLA